MEILSWSERNGSDAIRVGRIVILALTFACGMPAQVEEYHVKAAFLYYFARFVEWPAQSFRGPRDPIAICILGENPFGEVLTEVVRGKAVDGRPFAVRQITDVAKSSCQILFVAPSGRRRFRSFAGSLKGAAILTVGDGERFIEDGGIINFKLEGGRIRFEINVDAAEQAKLNISSKLLSLAQIVRR